MRQGEKKRLNTVRRLKYISRLPDNENVHRDGRANMGHIRGGRWLDVSLTRTGSFAIHESACLQRLVEGMPIPANQHPQLWVFLGSTQKNRCLQAIFAHNAFTRAPLGAIRLRTDLATIQNDSPIWFADGDPWSISMVPDANPARSGSKYCLDWNPDSAKEVVHKLFSHVLFPFAHTVCLFADDFPNECDLADLVTRHGSTADCPHRARPRLVIVGREVGSSTWSSIISSNRMSAAFSAVSIFRPGDTDGDYNRLKGLLEAHSQDSQKMRQGYTGQLSGTQLKLFLRSAMTHLAMTRSSPYDPIQSSRVLDDVPPDVGRNIRDFFDIAANSGLIDQDSVRFVASALLMDHYLPGMPCKLDALDC
jgi:hypothetical protein